MSTSKIIAHRCGNEHFTENSLPALRTAAKLPIHGIEIDVRLSSDNVPIVFHDETLQRLCHDPSILKSKTASQITSYRLPDGSSPPLLRECLEAYFKTNDSGVVYVEGKDSGWAEVVCKLITEFIENGIEASRFCIISFTYNDLMLCRGLLPTGVATIYILKKHPFSHLLRSRRLGSTCVGLNKRYANKISVGLIHACGLKLYTYTINSAKEYKCMRSLGVDYIATDKPDELLILSQDNAE